MADKSKLGMEFPPYSILIEKAKIAEFAFAISQKEEDSQPVATIYNDEATAKKAGYRGITTPPTFASNIIFWTGGGLMGTIKALGADLNKLLHSEEEYEYFAPVYAGDVITRKTKVVDMYERGRKERPGRFVSVTVLETEMTNQRGELVIKTRTLFMER